MKELTIEEKAKAYDEVVNKLKGFIAQGVDPLITRADVQDFFPEFKESEDERIIKSLKNCFKWLRDDARWTDVYGSSFESVFAWLKKQGEQKSIDDLTQQEAMDIAVAKCFEQEERKPILDIEIPFGAKDSELQEASYHIPEGFHTEIEGNKVVIKKTEQKPAWSEEDERMLDIILNDINYAQKNFSSSKLTPYTIKVNWFKSLKDRVQPQPKQDVSIQINPSEYINDMGGNGCYLKNTTQKPVEWSEEDNDTLNRCISLMSYNDAAKEETDWLKSLKEKIKGE